MRAPNAPDAAAPAWATLGIQDPESVRFVLAQLVAVGLRILGADEGSLLVAEPRRKVLRFAMVAGPDGMPPSADSLIGKEVPIGEGVTGMAALTHDVQTASAAEGATGGMFRRVRGDGSPHAVLAAPMLLGDDLVGVVTAVSFDRRKSFTAEQTRTYGMLANVAASVVEQQRKIESAARRVSAGKGTAATPAVPGPDAEEQALLRDILDFIHSHPGRVAAMRDILSALSRLP